MKIPFTELRHDYVWLSTLESDCIIWKDVDGDYHSFDIIPVNWPSITMGTYDNEDKAKKTVQRMVNEGWEISDNRLWPDKKFEME